MSGRREALLALADRCEAAEGPDAMLDAAIMVVLDVRPNWLLGAPGVMWFSSKPKDTDIAGVPVVRWCHEGMRKTVGCPPAGKPLRYTASIDAAMTLIPDGWSFTIRRKLVELRHPHLHRKDANSFSGCTALALIAACLRAYVEMEPKA